MLTPKLKNEMINEKNETSDDYELGRYRPKSTS